MFSTLTKTRVAGALIGAAIAFTAVAPGASAGQDLRSPDARDSSQDYTRQDLRSPDTRDGSPASTRQDLRSPDARDSVAPTLVPQPVSDRPSSPGGFDWVSAAIGAAAGTGLLIVLLAFLATGGLAGRRPITGRTRAQH
jgi:hypothetical protein